MRKRLRKKNRLGEFRELEFSVTFRLDARLDAGTAEQFVRELVEAVEARGLTFVGAGDTEWYGAVSRLGRGSPNAEDQEFVRALLAADPRVQSATIGELRDAWHGQRRGGTDVAAD